MANKFTKTDELKEEFEKEKIRMANIKQFLNKYKNSL
jgi:hypothetical protein